ncbi:hypothetical protein [Spirillospora sp. NPDC047279]|uniref:hypothetical protein n=1 Tax=Spirillospora sp. NPDC047279 TaxID=3155478 RepID=UPI0033E0300E
MSETSGPRQSPRDDAPEADLAEQLEPVGDRDDESDESDEQEWPQQVPLDVNEADAVENARTVRIDEDDYR